MIEVHVVGVCTRDGCIMNWKYEIKLVPTDYCFDCSIRVYCVMALCTHPSWHDWWELRIGINIMAKRRDKSCGSLTLVFSNLCLFEQGFFRKSIKQRKVKIVYKAGL